jgi:hypothetical protein
MKNLKNMLVVAGLMVGFIFEASTANAGVVIIMRADQGVAVQPNDTQSTNTSQCSTGNGGFFQKAGLMLSDIRGLMMSDARGLMMSDAPTAETNCTDDSSYGLLVTD